MCGCRLSAGSGLRARYHTEQFAERVGRALEGVVELVGIFSACLGEVSLASTLSADNRRELLNTRIRWDTVDEIFGHRGQEGDFAVRGTSEDDDSALDFGAQLVGEIAQIAAGDIVRATSDQLDAVDINRFVFGRRSARRFHSKLSYLALQLLLPFLKRAHIRGQLGQTSVELLLDLVRGLVEILEVLERTTSGERLHAANSGRERPIRHDLEHADV